MIRGGHVDLGAGRDGRDEEGKSGELDDPGKMVKGMGGAMDRGRRTQIALPGPGGGEKGGFFFWGGGEPKF